MPEKGKVKWFSNVKGYGFIVKEGGGPDIFVHYKSIQGDHYKTLVQDEEVTFDIVEGEKGPHAANVVRTKKPAAEKETAGTPPEKKEIKPAKAEKPGKQEKAEKPAKPEKKEEKAP